MVFFQYIAIRRSARVRGHAEWVRYCFGGGDQWDGTQLVTHRMHAHKSGLKYVATARKYASETKMSHLLHVRSQNEFCVF